jgi:hypothetical protein
MEIIQSFASILMVGSIPLQGLFVPFVDNGKFYALQPAVDTTGKGSAGGPVYKHLFCCGTISAEGNQVILPGIVIRTFRYEPAVGPDLGQRQ